LLLGYTKEVRRVKMRKVFVDKEYREWGKYPLIGDGAGSPAYIELTYEGTLSVGEYYELANESEKVKSGEALIWEIPSNLAVGQIEELIIMLLPIMHRIHERHYRSWAGQGYIYGISGIQYYNKAVKSIIKGIDKTDDI